MARGFDVVSGGTDNHLILVDLTNKNVPGKIAAKALDKAGIELNYNSVPYDTRKPFDPLGDPPGFAVGHQPGHGRRRDEADRRLDGPGGRQARRRGGPDGDRRRGAGADPEVPGPGHLRLAAAGRSDRETNMAKGTDAGWISARAGASRSALAAGTARAEVIELLDKTKMNGKVIHFYDGVYTIEAGGQTMKLPKDKIKSISFTLPAPRAEFSTPEKTFDRWRKSLTDGTMDKAIDCYALVYQGMLAKQMELGEAKGGIKQMRKEIEGTKFQIKGSPPRATPPR